MRNFARILVGFLAASAFLAVPGVSLLAGEPPAVPCRADRLLATADVVSRLPAERLKMNNWGSTLDAQGSDFVGCALGHATAIFGREGLTMAVDGSGMRAPRYRNLYGYEAAAAFYGMPLLDTYSLFCAPPDHSSPAEVAGKIRAYAIEHGGGGPAAVAARGLALHWCLVAVR